MDMTLFSPVVLVLYFVVVLLITFLSKGGKSAVAFSIGNRNIGTFATTASIASGLRDGAGIAIWLLLAAYMGYGTMWLAVGTSIGFFMFALGAKRIVRDAHEHNFVTQVDVYKKHFGPRTARLATFILSAMAFLVSAAQLSIAGAILGAVFGLGVVTSTIVVVGIVGAYLFIGGYDTVIKTDLFQWGLIFVIAIVLPLLFFGDGVSFAAPSFLELATSDKFGFAGISALVVFMSADIWQRVFSAQNQKTGRNALLLSIPLYALISLGMVVFGIAVFGVMADADPTMLVQAMFTHGAVSGGVLALMSIFVLASVMSTLDTNVFMFSQFVARHMLRKAGKDTVRQTRGVLLVVLVLLGVVATLVSDIVTFLFGAYTIGTVLVPLLGLYVLSRDTWRKSDGWFAAIVSLSSLIYIYFFVTGAFGNILMTLVPAGVSTMLVVLYVGVMRVFRK